MNEMVHDLGLGSSKNLTPHLRSLESKGFVLSATAAGRRYFLLLDPRETARRLAASGTLSTDDLFELNDLLADLKQPPLEIQLPAEDDHVQAEED